MDAELSPVVEIKAEPEKSAKDNWNLVYFFFVLQGVGTILPWNMFVNAGDYFTKYKFVEQEEYAKNYLVYVGICSQVPNLLLSLINTLLPSKGGLLARIVGSLCLMATVFLVTLVMASIDTSQWVQGFFVLTMLSVVLTACATGMLQNALYGVASDFPMTYPNAVVLGSNISGTLTSVLYLISLAVSPGYQMTAMIYFASALFTICLCVLTFLLIRYNVYFRYTYAKGSALVSDISSDGLSVGQRIRQSLISFYQVAREVKVQLFNIFFVFFISLSIFPTVMADIEAVSLHFPLSSKYFAPVTCFLIFNTFAVIGSIASNWLRFPSARRIWIPVVLRALFTPFFLFCNYKPRYRTIPVIFQADWLYIIMAILLAFTSGHMSSLIMMYTPRLVEPNKARVAGMLAALFLVFGIFCGINFVVLLNYFVENSGPCTAGKVLNATAPICP